MRILITVLTILLSVCAWASTPTFQASYLITNVITNAISDGGPCDLKLSGTIVDNSSLNFTAENVLTNDLIIYWNTNYGVATTYKITNIINQAGNNLECDASGNIVWDASVETNWIDYGPAPEVGSYSIISSPTIDMAVNMPSLTYTATTEYLHNAARNLTIDKATVVSGIGWAGHIATNLVDLGTNTLVNVHGLTLNSSYQTNWGITNAILIEATNYTAIISNSTLYITIKTNYFTNDPVVLSHLNLLDIQGGTNREYWHVDSTQLADIVWVNSNANAILSGAQQNNDIYKSYVSYPNETTGTLNNATNYLNIKWKESITNIVIITSNTNTVTTTNQSSTLSLNTYSVEGINGQVVNSYTWMSNQTFNGVKLAESNISITVSSQTPIPASNTWTKVTDLPAAVWGVSVANIGNNLYIFGGNAVSGGGNTNVWKYDGNTFTSVAQCPLVLSSCQVGVNPACNYFYVLNNSTFTDERLAKFDGTNWTSFNIPNYYLHGGYLTSILESIILFDTSTIYLVGGFNMQGGLPFTDIVKLISDWNGIPYNYDAVLDYMTSFIRGGVTWWTKLRGRTWSDRGVGDPNNFYPEDYSMRLLGLKYYYGTDFAFDTVANMPAGRFWTSAIYFNNAIYVVGGCDSTATSVNTVYRCNFGTCTASTPLPETLANPALVVYNNRLWVIGGVQGTSGGILKNTCYSFDGTNWTAELSIPASTDGSSATVIGDYIYVVADGSIYKYSASVTTPEPLQLWYDNTNALVAAVYSHSNVFSKIIYGDGTGITNASDANAFNYVTITKASSNTVLINDRTLNITVETNTAPGDSNTQMISRVISFEGLDFNTLYADTSLDAPYSFRIIISESPTFATSNECTSASIINWAYWNGINMIPLQSEYVLGRYLNDYQARVSYTWPDAIRNRTYYIKGEVIDVTSGDTMSTINQILGPK